MTPLPPPRCPPPCGASRTRPRQVGWALRRGAPALAPPGAVVGSSTCPLRCSCGRCCWRLRCGPSCRCGRCGRWCSTVGGGGVARRWAGQRGLSRGTGETAAASRRHRSWPAAAAMRKDGARCCRRQPWSHGPSATRWVATLTTGRHRPHPRRRRREGGGRVPAAGRRRGRRAAGGTTGWLATVVQAAAPPARGAMTLARGVRLGGPPGRTPQGAHSPPLNPPPIPLPHSLRCLPPFVSLVCVGMRLSPVFLSSVVAPRQDSCPPISAPRVRPFLSRTL